MNRFRSKLDTHKNCVLTNDEEDRTRGVEHTAGPPIMRPRVSGRIRRPESRRAGGPLEIENPVQSASLPANKALLSSLLIRLS